MSFLALQCGTAFQEDDVIVLNGTKEDVEILKNKMEDRRLRAKLEKVMSGRLCFCPPLQSLGQRLACRPCQPPPLLQGPSQATELRWQPCCGCTVIVVILRTLGGLGFGTNFRCGSSTACLRQAWLCLSMLSFLCGQHPHRTWGLQEDVRDHAGKALE
jgi:hypothetical protein